LYSEVRNRSYTGWFIVFALLLSWGYTFYIYMHPPLYQLIVLVMLVPALVALIVERFIDDIN
jgi:apolipoprotein N-acyltransferase